MAKIRLDNDYTRTAHYKVINKIQSNLDFDFPGYGEDKCCKEATNIIRSLIKKPDASVYFLTGATQANLIIISAALSPVQSVICADTGHIFCHEAASAEHTGHKVQALPSSDGKITAEQIEEIAESYYKSPKDYLTEPKLVYISFPTELGTLYSRSELEAISSICKRYNMYLFVDGARFAGVADDDFIEEARFSEIGPPARRGLVLQFPDAVEVIAKSECGKTEPVVTPFRSVEQFAAEGLRNDFRREEFRIEFFDFCVDGESGIGIPSKLECSAARHEVDADGDVRFEERFACGNRIRGSARLLVAAECSCGAFVPGKTALGAVAPELRLIAVGDVAHDVGGSAGGTVVENNVASEFPAVVLSERLFPLVFDAFAVRGDDDEAFGFILRDFRLRCAGTQEERNGEDACENQQDGDCFQIHCAGVPFWFL